MKKLLKALTLILVIGMLSTLISCAAAITPTQQPTPVPTTPPLITLTVMQNSMTNIVATGIQTDPVAKYIKDKFGIQLDFPTLMSGNFDAQLSAMIASNDLPDLILISARLQDAAAAKAIIPLDDYLANNAPNFTSVPELKTAVKYFQTYRSVNSDGKLYGFPMGGGLDVPVNGYWGNYVRWDVYKQIGYPAVASQNDLLNVLAQMQAADPVTPDGKKVYAIGNWFGDVQGWADWILICLPFLNGDSVVSEHRLELWNLDTESLSPVNQLTDTNSDYWQSVKWFNKAYQMGILDPDSFIQKNDQYITKLNNGQYLWNFINWAVDNYG